MSNYKQDILNYGDDVKNLDCSPYEQLRMVNDRTEIQKNIDKLTNSEITLLRMFDLMLLNNVEEMLNHISNVYDFTLSDKNNIPYTYWWWHLDKIVKGDLVVGSDVSPKRNQVKTEVFNSNELIEGN
ncbi:hypothetical protein [Thalassobacillus sp. C254]|uniref:hypothetical protein n=1 Tax=Thalassobacillus sp. C254 TaxID=1225341 RepID=UPI0006D21561|nr:hypothetical protein [Thalassobacillus sp. C254]